MCPSCTALSSKPSPCGTQHLGLRELQSESILWEFLKISKGPLGNVGTVMGKRTSTTTVEAFLRNPLPPDRLMDAGGSQGFSRQLSQALLRSGCVNHECPWEIQVLEVEATAESKLQPRLSPPAPRQFQGPAHSF